MLSPRSLVLKGRAGQKVIKTPILEKARCGGCKHMNCIMRRSRQDMQSFTATYRATTRFA